MKKLIIVSDSHGSYQVLVDLLNKEKDADIFIHLGDFEIPLYLMDNFLYVKGNCDYDPSIPLKKDIIVENLKIHLEHGNNHSFLINKLDYVRATESDIFLYGHSHIYNVEKINNTYLINPGSILRPRDGNIGTYIELILDNKKIISITKKSL